MEILVDKTFHQSYANIYLILLNKMLIACDYAKHMFWTFVSFWPGFFFLVFWSLKSIWQVDIWYKK